jgi:hypothetical protein
MRRQGGGNPVTDDRGVEEQKVIDEWRSHLRMVRSHLETFEQALDYVTTDEEFMRAYHYLGAYCGDILDGFDLSVGGSVDDLRAAVVVRAKVVHGAE